MTSNLILAVVFVKLAMILCWAIASRAYWKRKASRNGGVTLVCYSLELLGETKSYRQINLKHFPGKLTEALENAHGFLERDGFQQINTASRARVFARGNDGVKIYFLNDGIMSETIL